jgi:hypothetical protein
MARSPLPTMVADTRLKNTPVSLPRVESTGIEPVTSCSPDSLGPPLHPWRGANQALQPEHPRPRCRAPVDEGV